MEVDGDAGEPVGVVAPSGWSGDDEVVVWCGCACAVSSHVFENGTEAVAGLGCDRRPVSDDDASAGDGGCGHEGGGIGQVGFDNPFVGLDRAGLYLPCVGCWHGDIDSGVVEHRDGHGDMRL